MAHQVNIKLEKTSDEYFVHVGHDLLNSCGDWAQKNISKQTKSIALFSNEKVFSLYGEMVKHSLQTSGYEVFVWLMKDGEEFKNLDSLEESLNFLSSSKLVRTDAVISLGGGVVGDLAGFASSVYLRGIQFLQIPTTLLAMIDSSVGGKTGVNTQFGKNLVGTFYQPKGVLVDVHTLKTLEKREIAAGFYEVIKQGAIGSYELFESVANYLKTFSLETLHNDFVDDNFVKELEVLLASQLSFKAEIVMQDEKEDVSRSDESSRKILNFGHTLAHSLEKITDYKYFKHGEAVGYGILAAAQISKKLDILDCNSLKLLNDVVSSVGGLPDTENIAIDQVIEAFSHDKKNLGKSLQWVLLEGIGKPRIVQDQEIPRSIIKESLIKVLDS